ncbi:hypothetical protein, partial [Phaeobacter sp. JH20_39]
IECQIMDLADDIAYSTYDLEDCFQAAVVTPLDVISLTNDECEEITESMKRSISKEIFDGRINPNEVDLERRDILFIAWSIFGSLTEPSKEFQYRYNMQSSFAAFAAGTAIESKFISENNMLRRRWCEDFIIEAIDSVHLVRGWNADILAHSKIRVNTKKRLQIEFLKSFNYIKAIRSKKIRMNDARSKQVIEELFATFLNQDFSSGNNQELSLFPEEYRSFYKNLKSEVETNEESIRWSSIEAPRDVLQRLGLNNLRDSITNGELAVRMRLVCDYVSSLTDQEALASYNQLRSGETISLFGINT